MLVFGQRAPGHYSRPASISTYTIIRREVEVSREVALHCMRAADPSIINIRLRAFDLRRRLLSFPPPRPGRVGADSGDPRDSQQRARPAPAEASRIFDTNCTGVSAKKVLVLVVAWEMRDAAGGGDKRRTKKKIEEENSIVEFWVFSFHRTIRYVIIFPCDSSKLLLHYYLIDRPSSTI